MNFVSLAFSDRTSSPLSVQLSAEKTRYRQGEPIMLSVFDKNISSRSIQVLRSNFWSTHKFEAYDELGQALVDTQNGLFVRSFYGSLDRRKTYFVELLPGKADIPYGPFDIREIFHLKPLSRISVRAIRDYNGREVASNYISLVLE
jgi:hypothetical protein